MVGRTRAVYSPFVSSSYELNAAFPVVSFVENCARFVGLERGRIHHLENMARFGEGRFIEQLHGLLRGAFDTEKIPAALSELTGVSQRRPDDTLEKVHYDLAASLCELLSNEIVTLLRSLLKIQSEVWGRTLRWRIPELAFERRDRRSHPRPFLCCVVCPRESGLCYWWSPVVHGQPSDQTVDPFSRSKV